ncbi:MAG: radical SAM protein [Burkholderiales bacterium]|nr:radical SAM protein [Burkholderiales bacterium]MBH2016763.1 radical SAM protein [Burkholderiales bacterium]
MNHPSTDNIAHLKELVVNWHVTEACNFKCQYCYAEWQRGEHPREVIHRPEARARLLGELAQFFAPENASNPLTRSLRWNSIRLNIAGGEPLLYDREVLSIAQQARNLGFAVSVITNGSLLSPELTKELAPLISMLGVSVDSVSSDTNKLIGRMSRGGKTLAIEQLAEIFRNARQQNPLISIKINTVVNQANRHDDMSDAVQSFGPDKWKIFRMLPITTDRLMVTGGDYKKFIDRHEGHGLPMSVEDNSDMIQSYIMVDPQGRFFQNKTESRLYQYSRPIHEVGARAAFNEVKFSMNAYMRRYLVGGRA